MYYIVKRKKKDVAIVSLNYLMMKMTRKKYKKHPEKEMMEICERPFLTRKDARNSLQNNEDLQFSEIKPEMVTMIKSNSNSNCKDERI